MRITKSLWFGVQLLAACACSLHADPIPVLSCTGCFAAGETPTLGVSVFDAIDPQYGGPVVSYSVNGSTVPLMGSQAVQTLSSLANLSYTLDFANGFQTSQQTHNGNGYDFGQTTVSATVTDYLLVRNATPGSTVSVTEAVSATGTSTPTGPNIGSHSGVNESFYVTPPTSQYPGFTYASPCFFLQQNDFNAPISSSCSDISILPSDGIVMLTLDSDSYTLSLSAGTSASLGSVHTSFSNVQVLDANGLPETGVQLYSASGTNYNAAVTPEPNPLILVGSANLLLLFFRRRFTCRT